MTTSAAAKLNEGYRDALLAYYMGQYLPNYQAGELQDSIRDTNDIYEYLLIDPLVTQQVTTSKASAAMTSIQQYLNSLALNMEPGFDSDVIDPDTLSAWKQGANQYSLWAGAMELDTYPENYIDPSLRSSKTIFFKNLETTLNQNQINSDNAQTAVLNYLNEFEQIANLDVVSGYMDGFNLEKDIYYFIGRSKDSPAVWYWRSLDMGKRENGIIPASAWSEWIKVEVNLAEETLTGTVRPVMFNNRLYLTWWERTITGDQETSSDTTIHYSATITAYVAYKKYDNSWSAPQVLGSQTGGENSWLYSTDKTNLFTLSVQDDPSSSDKRLSLCVSLVTNNHTQYLQYRVDEWFNAITHDSSFDISNYFSYFCTNEHQYRIQTKTAGSAQYYLDLISSNNVSDSAHMLSKISPVKAGDIKITENANHEVIVNFDLKATLNNYLYAKIKFHDTEIISMPGADFAADLQMGGEVIYFSGYLDCNGKFINADVDIGVCYSFGSPGVFKRVGMGWGKSNSIGLINFSLSSPVSKMVSQDIAEASELGGRFYFYQTDSQGNTSYLGTTQAGGHTFDHPNTKTVLSGYLDNWESTNRLATHEFSSTDKTQTYSLTIPYTVPHVNEPVTITYGVSQTLNGASYGNSVIKISFIVKVGVADSPKLNSIADATLGKVQFLDFSQFSSTISAIRLNTLFAKELVAKANISIDALLAWDTQLTLEPALTAGGTAVPMDFNGANGLYFWELFFYMPYLVAWRLNQEQQYAQARNWYHYLFDPSARGRVSSNPLYPQPDYWNSRPIVTPDVTDLLADSLINPLDPDSVAMSEPVHYRKNLFMVYVRNILDQADNFYRQLTPDALGNARLGYAQVSNLLGPDPALKIVNQWQPQTLAEVSASPNLALRNFEQQLISTTDLPLLSGGLNQALAVQDNANFVSPLNVQLLAFWQTLNGRLFNLRHNLSINGQPMILPLYAPPANPTQLMQQRAQGGSLLQVAGGAAINIPAYRFRVLLPGVYSAISTLTQFGSNLLSFYERGESAALQELDQQQAVDLSEFAITLQEEALNELQAERDAMYASREVTAQRFAHYRSLYEDNLTDQEESVLNSYSASAALIAAAPAMSLAGAALDMAPNIFGLAVGGSKWGGLLYSGFDSLQSAAMVTQTAAQRIQISEEWRRRRDEWKIQYQQAEGELNAIDKQLDTLSIRQQSAQTSLAQAKQQQHNLQSTLTFLNTRFSQSSLYNWLAGQMAALYYQAYDAVITQALNAQSAWQYEIGDFTTVFINTSAWNNSYRGLLVGENLQLNVQQMEAAWLGRNTRRLEMTKTISLRQLLGSQFDVQRQNGVFSFTLNETLFDNDYPGQYLRQIKYVSVSLPTLIGPWQDVRALLTQTGSSTLLKADILGVQYLQDPTTGSDSNVIANLRASQQVAISRGLSDSGLFELSFGDERYLPFEGTGAISGWQLSFPNPAHTEQKALLDALNDVIVQVNYTALYGGTTFEEDVKATLS
ncbi:Tc toxin subunit A-related protein [Rahnella aquatilis]|uniref:Tc toxin subunit A-related protein n=1 Tax=Rahnella aquatilis TaxID=34038 RepID=UPI003654C591